MGLRVPHPILLVYPRRTGLELADLGSLWDNPGVDALNSALPLIPAHQKDKSEPLRGKARKTQLLHLLHFDNKREEEMVPFIWAK